MTTWKRTTSDEADRLRYEMAEHVKSTSGSTLDIHDMGQELADPTIRMSMGMRATRIEGGDELSLRCDVGKCERLADTIYFTPNVVNPEEIFAACPDHYSDEGYYLPIAELRTRPIGWITHLAEKIGDVVPRFLWWLGQGDYNARKLLGGTRVEK